MYIRYKINATQIRINNFMQAIHAKKLQSGCTKTHLRQFRKIVIKMLIFGVRNIKKKDSELMFKIHNHHLCTKDINSMLLE